MSYEGVRYGLASRLEHSFDCKLSFDFRSSAQPWSRQYLESCCSTLWPPWFDDALNLTAPAADELLGTGKTSLCQALAQQLAIRLGSQFPSCKLVKVDAQSVFSKWFSESGKMVIKLFASIETMLDEDEHTFVCVLIDEIESLAGTRQHTPGANEPKDALRVMDSRSLKMRRLPT